MLPRIPLHLHPRVVTFAACYVSLVVAMSTSACGQCLKLQSEWQDRLVLELLDVGAGTMPDSGANEHVRVILGPRMLSNIADAVGRATPLRAVRLQRRMGTLADDPVVAMQVGYALTRVAVELVEGRPMLRMQLSLQGSALVQRTLSDETGNVNGTAEVLAPLTLSSERGAVQLTLQIAGGTVLQFSAAPDLIDQSEADFAEALLREDLLTQLAQLTGDLPVWTLEPLAIGRLSVRFAATRLTPLASGRAVEIGLVTNLRPGGGEWSMFGDEPATSDDVTWLVHPGLPEAAVHYAVANGVVERSFHAETPSLHQEVTVDFLRLDDEGFDYSITRWCFSHAPCSATRERGSGALASTRTGILVTATGSGDSASSEGRAFVDGMQQVVELVLRTPEMRLADDQPVLLELQTLHANADGILSVLQGVETADDSSFEQP